MTFNVVQALSGSEALELINNADVDGQRFEIVFLDWQITGMSGIDTAQAIHALSLKTLPHIVMTTAIGCEIVIKEIVNAGIEDILIKPISASMLFNTTMLFLDERRDNIRTIVHTPSSIETRLMTIRGAWILVVEDNELNQEVAVDLLTGIGFNVELANNGQEALEKIASTRYDLVLMDMQMPVMDGVAATIALRHMVENQHLPIVAMTANAMQQDKELCLSAGMNDYISKPIETDELFAVLLKWIKARHAGTQVAELEKVVDTMADVALPVIDGLDTVAAVQRILGKTSLYFSMLRNYVTNQANTVAAIRTALNADDVTTAERIAHTIKGLSGSIGATELQAMAAEIEKLIREKATRDEIDDKLATFEIAQNTMIAALQAVMPMDESHLDRVNIDNAGEVLGELKQLLEADDSKATNLFKANFNLLQLVFSADVFAKLERAIMQFDFEKALGILG
jgi:two-component system sensor histidine kinase/response regulator